MSATATAQSPTPEESVYEYEGVGLQLSGDQGKLWIVDVYENGPAELAGIQPGDLLLRVDGQPVAPPKEPVSKRLVGPTGSVVKITVGRGTETLEVSVRRGLIAR